MSDNQKTIYTKDKTYVINKVGNSYNVDEYAYDLSGAGNIGAGGLIAAIALIILFGFCIYWFVIGAAYLMFSAL